MYLADSESKASLPRSPLWLSLPGSMGLVMADLISPVAGSLYYFLVYSEIMGSKQKGPAVTSGAGKAGGCQFSTQPLPLPRGGRGKLLPSGETQDV